MARCPNCDEVQDWWKLLRLDRTRLMSCRRCGSVLALDSQRSIILLGGLIAVLALPETGLLPFDWNTLWFMGVLVVYIPFYIAYTKLVVIREGDLAVSPNQEPVFHAYAARRRRVVLVGHALFWGGFMLFLLGLGLPSPRTSEVVAVLGLASMFAGIWALSITRCPFCGKFTVQNPFDNGGRCIHCHRHIDVSE